MDPSPQPWLVFFGFLAAASLVPVIGWYGGKMFAPKRRRPPQA